MFLCGSDEEVYLSWRVMQLCVCVYSSTWACYFQAQVLVSRSAYDFHFSVGHCIVHSDYYMTDRYPFLSGSLFIMCQRAGDATGYVLLPTGDTHCRNRQQKSMDLPRGIREVPGTQEANSH